MCGVDFKVWPSLALFSNIVRNVIFCECVNDANAIDAGVFVFDIDAVGVRFPSFKVHVGLGCPQHSNATPKCVLVVFDAMLDEFDYSIEFSIKLDLVL